MSEIIANKDAILQAAAEKFVSLGQEGAIRIIGGKNDKVQAEKARRILALFLAYVNVAELSDDDHESVLYALRELSEAEAFPTVSPFIGQRVTNLLSVVETVGLIVQNQSVDLQERARLDFRYDLQASDDGSVIHVDVRDPYSSVVVGATITLDFELKRAKTFLAGSTISTPIALVFDDDDNAVELKAFVFTIDAGVGITMPVGSLMSDARRVANVWTSPDAGTFVMWGFKVNGTWILFVSIDKLT